jgi:hypothetical protein
MRLFVIPLGGAGRRSASRIRGGPLAGGVPARMGGTIGFSLSEPSFGEGAMRSSAAQIIDLQKERDALRVQVADLTAQSADFKTQGGALLAASCGLVPFIGICARFALQPRRRRQSCSSRRASSHRRRSCLPSALRGWRLSSSCAAQRRRARTRLWRKSHNWSRRRL